MLLIIKLIEVIIVSAKVEIDSKLAKDISEIVKEENISKSKVLSDAIKTLKKELKDKNEPKIPEHLIANKNRKPDPKLTEELIGSIKLDKPIDVAKVIKESRMRY